MKLREHPYLSLVFLTGLNLFNYLDRYVLSAVLPPLQTDLRLNDAQGGFLASAFMLGYFVSSPLFGYLGDRSSRKWLIAFGVFFWSVGTILSAFCHSYGAMIACRVLVGLGEASYATLAPAWLADLFPKERRNNALTIFYVAIPVGSALGYGAGSLALMHGNWRDGFFWAGLPGIILALLLLFLREPRRGAADSTNLADGSTALPAEKPTWRDNLRLFRLPEFCLVLLGYTAYTFALGAFAVWGPKFLHLRHHLELHKADFFFSATLAASGLLGTMIGGFVATAWHRRNPAGYSLLLTLSIAAAVPVATVAFLSANTAVSMTCLAAAMFLLFLSTGPTNTLIVESVPVALRASAMATSIFVIHLFGDFISPPAIGRLADWWQQPQMPATGLQRAVLVLPGVLAIGAIFWGWLAWRQARGGTGQPELAQRKA